MSRWNQVVHLRIFPFFGLKSIVHTEKTIGIHGKDLISIGPFQIHEELDLLLRVCAIFFP